MNKPKPTRKQRHSFAGARWSAKDERLVLGQPGVEQTLVSDGVERGDDDVGRRHFVRLHFDLRHALRPGIPLAGNGHFVVQDGDVGLRRQRNRRDAADEVTQFLTNRQTTVA